MAKKKSVAGFAWLDQLADRKIILGDPACYLKTIPGPCMPFTRSSLRFCTSLYHLIEPITSLQWLPRWVGGVSCGGARIPVARCSASRPGIGSPELGMRSQHEQGLPAQQHMHAV